MKPVLQLLSLLGLVLTVGPSFFVFTEAITWDTHATLMAVGTLLWFATAPFWILDQREATSQAPASERSSTG